MPSFTQTNAVARFTCLGDACEDTCCKGWGMQLTRETIDKYKAEAPELLEAVVSGEAEFVMKRDPETDFCVKFDQGWCAIHRDYGSDFLGDACHFFPRITRAIGETVLTTAALSCPESARLMLMEEGAFTLAPRAELRVPFSLKQYLADMGEEEALALHELFVTEAGNPEFSAEENVMRVSAVVQALALQPVPQWPQAAVFYFKMAAGRLPVAEAEATDPFNLTHALAGLVAASKNPNRPRLRQTIDGMTEMLGISFTDGGIALTPDAAQKFLLLRHHWKTVAGQMQPILRRYLQAQMSIAFFPFAGLGLTLADRMTVIGVRFATLKLALMAEAKKEGGLPAENTVIRVAQSLSRFLDHLADPTLSLQIYHEAGWVREPRLRALLME
jgi:lysine-N-methylase